MRKKLKQLNRILESLESFALVEPFVSPEVALNSIFQDIVDALGMSSYNKKIYHKDMYGGDADEGEMSGQITFGWIDGDHVGEVDVSSTVKVSLSPSYMVATIFNSDGSQWDRITNSRDGGNYVSLINDIVASIMACISNQKKLANPLFHNIDNDSFDLSF